VRKWGKYLPVVTLLFPGGLFIVGVCLVVEFFRHRNDLAEEYWKGLADSFKRKEEGS